jgi:hypothetical protein
VKARVHIEDHGVVLASFDGHPAAYSVARHGGMVTVSLSYPVSETQAEDVKKAAWRPTPRA